MRIMSLVPTDRRVLTPFRRFAPIFAGAAINEFQQVARSIFHDRVSNTFARGSNSVSNTNSVRNTPRKESMVRRQGVKRRRYSRPTYRSKRRRTSRFRRRGRTRNNRIPRNRFRRGNNYMKLFSRNSNEISPVSVGGNDVIISYLSPRWNVLPKLVASYAKIYDEWKPLKVVTKLFVLIPSLQLAEGSSKIQHWWVYDPDSNGRTFATTEDFTNHPSVKLNFMTPYKVSTYRLKAKFSFNVGTAEAVTTGIKKVDNPWRNLEEWNDGVGLPHQNCNSIQHLFVGKTIENVPAYKIIAQSVYTFLVRGNRNGQQYAV